MSKKEIDEALQQFQGFVIGATGGQIEELISSMGLTKEEWESIKNDENGILNWHCISITLF